jgi:hypothetical protein
MTTVRAKNRPPSRGAGLMGIFTHLPHAYALQWSGEEVTRQPLPQFFLYFSCKFPFFVGILDKVSNIL